MRDQGRLQPDEIFILVPLTFLLSVACITTDALSSEVNLRDTLVVHPGGRIGQEPDA